MDFNLIDTAPMFPGWGQVWQGGTVDAAIQQLPTPLAIVCMDQGELNEQWISHPAIDAVLAVWINDSPDAILPDAIYIALVDAAIAILKKGINLYVHCAAGVSRASYFDIGLHMRAEKISFDQAFNLVHSARPVANPNAGFVQHLKRLEAQLIS
jgi:predicted protein tyrosine phosphatase